MTASLSSQSKKTVSLAFHGSPISFETGWIAKQAGGSVVVRQGDTMILCTVCRAAARPDQDFFPLTVEYQEKFYAAGKIPGGFIKREGRPAEHEILTCRLIDRPIRPLFADDYYDEVQVICTVLSVDGKHSPDVLSICGASAALHLSGLPFHGPLGGVRVGRVNGELVINPSPETVKQQSDIDFIVAGTRDSIIMVEGGAQGIPEKDILDALYFGHQEIQKLLDLQDELKKLTGRAPVEIVPVKKDTTISDAVKKLAEQKLFDALRVAGKAERRDAIAKVKELVNTELPLQHPEKENEIAGAFDDLSRMCARVRTVRDKVRVDGRALTDVRPIECEVGVIPRAHGSSLFTRGETQAFVTTTLGTSVDAQRVDTLTSQSEKTFMLHYNFPPYSTGEVKMLRGTGRREVGHGALAERALTPVIPKATEFPYVIRIVSDITESNGSSSMASVCGGCLSLMDAGVAIREPVAGVAMGLIKEGNDIAVLTDILGDEDHYGDMDFKVCGTKAGVTALQMDIKCRGLSRQTMEQALEQARTARLHILGEMTKAISAPRTKMSQYAPTIEKMKINPDKIRDVIGPGGKTIRSIVETTGVKIDVSDDGTISLASSDQEATRRAKEIIMGLTEEPEIGKIYAGVVKRLADFGAFVEILPGIEGLVHVSQLDFDRVERVSDIVKEGDEIPVLVLDIDRQGRIRLSRKEAIQEVARKGM